MDSEADFMRKTRDMFQRVEQHFEEIAVQFVVQVAEILVDETPGWERQWPDTTYEPTGRLRGGYYVSDTKLDRATNWDDGPYSPYGEETVAKIEAAMRARGPLNSFWIVNNTAYGYMVLTGMGVHGGEGRGPRDFVGATAASQRAAFRMAMARVRRGA